LTRELHERLTEQHHLHNLIWLWEPSLAQGGPCPATLEDFYPGPIGTDALMLDVGDPAAIRGYGVRGATAVAGSKPVGLRTHAPLPDTAANSFAWTDIVPRQGAPASTPSTNPWLAPRRSELYQWGCRFTLHSEVATQTPEAMKLCC
jgi:hypothetical protein